MELSQDELYHYFTMTPEQRAALPGRVKQRIVSAMVGRQVGPQWQECHDPFAALEIFLQLKDKPASNGREPRDVTAEQFFHNRQRGGYR